MTKMNCTLSAATAVCNNLDWWVKDIENKLLQHLSPEVKISIALNCWTSLNNLTFMTIVDYFININWKYHEVLLGFEHLSDKHTGHKITQIVDRVLTKYQLWDRLLVITTDNMSNNETLVRSLQNMLKSNDSFKTEHDHLSCLSHVLQLILKFLLKNIHITVKNEESVKIWANHSLNNIDRANDVMKTILKTCLYRAIFKAVTFANWLHWCNRYAS